MNFASLQNTPGPSPRQMAHASIEALDRVRIKTGAVPTCSGLHKLRSNMPLLIRVNPVEHKGLMFSDALKVALGSA